MKLRRFLPAAIVMMLAVLMLGACGGDDDDDDGGNGGTTATATAQPAASTEYPLTVTDMMGRSVTIDTAPTTVAALSPTTVEFVYAVGGTSVTRSKSVQYPEAAKSATDIGPSYQPNLELVVSENPDLIIADSMLQPQLVQDLEALGVPLVYAGVGTWDDIITGLELVGQVLDKQTEAQTAISDLEGVKSDIVSQLPGTGPKVLILNGTPDDFYAAKPESYVGALSDILGVTNVAEGAPDVGQFPGYTKLGIESIVADAPDVILAISAGPPGGQTITDALSADAAWATVPAVANGRVYEISVELYLQAPGPRAANGLQELAGFYYPEVYGQ
jgi:iron complex transport system substrate-binding protein